MGKPFYDLKELELVTHQKMVEYGVILDIQQIKLHPYYRVTLQRKLLFHSIITCLPSQKKFFLKVAKDCDGALICNNFLGKIYNEDGSCPYPLVVVPKFEFHGARYYITTFIEGKNLDELPEPLSESAWDNIADRLLFRLDELSTIQSPQYSERNGFISDDCATNLRKKFIKRLQHPFIAHFCHKPLEITVEKYCTVLEQCQYSSPALIHMDVKPANIIYNPQTGDVSLVDFEFARFGDVDYGWTQVLLSGCNQFSMSYKQKLVPRLTRNRLTLQDALKIPKFQCYLLYQTMCNLIYYYDRNLQCPSEINWLFKKIINEI